MRALWLNLRKLLHPGLAAFLLAAMAVVLIPAPVLAEPVERTIRVEANNYAFTPSTLYVNPGDTITIELVSKYAAHGLSIDGYPVDLRAEPGQTVRTTFVADRAGSFKFRCSIACGNLHPFMTGKFEVGPNWLFYRAAALGVLAFLFGLWGLSRG
jgi:heme/copper-type cytochrome/quinol oxidase subunit 2